MIKLLVASMLLMVAYAHAQTFPTRPVRIVVPFVPGGGTDLLARTLAVKLAATWSQQVLVDNRPGGGTVIGSDLVEKSAPDGHTLMLTANTHITNPALHAKLPYDTLRDFAGVTQIAAAPMVLTTHPALPARNVRELIALAKSKPGNFHLAPRVMRGRNIWRANCLKPPQVSPWCTCRTRAAHPPSPISLQDKHNLLLAAPSPCCRMRVAGVCGHWLSPPPNASLRCHCPPSQKMAWPVMNHRRGTASSP